MMTATNSSESEASSGDMAIIGEGTPNRMPISIQILQSIYHELTGKSEEVSKSYKDSFLADFRDFEQLNHRILQACEQYHIATENCSIQVFTLMTLKKPSVHLKDFVLSMLVPLVQ